MPRVAPVVPAETDILCEGCGYTLNGLPPGGNCPECGKSIGESTDPQLRRPPTWEQPHENGIGRFVTTTAQVLLRPTRFYRSLQTRAPAGSSAAFAMVHWLLASLLLGGAAAGHLMWSWGMAGMGRIHWGYFAAGWAGITMLALVFLVIVTHIAARLTAWEAAYRGIRLPLRTVLRGMHYHAAHYVPVAALAFVTVFAYLALLRHGHVDVMSGSKYLYILSGEVVLCAGYLFNTYWIGMRNMMYANR